MVKLLIARRDLVLATDNRFAAILPHGIPTHFDSMGIMNEPIEIAVGQRWITDLFVPAETGSCAVRIVERTW